MTPTAQFQISAGDFTAILPELILSAGGLLLIVMQLYLAGKKILHQSATTVIFLAAAAAALSGIGGVHTGFGGMVRTDSFAEFVSIIVITGGVLTVLLGGTYLDKRDWNRGEYYSLLLFAAAGMLFMVKGIDLLVLFLGLELLSISLYILAGFFRERLTSNEAALKYLLLGAFSSGFLLYGIAMLYGAYGTTNVAQMAAATPSSTLFLRTGVGMLLVGLGFKAAVVPFHMWSPDVYQGAPTPVTGFMATAVKAASFAALLRVMTSIGDGDFDWTPILWLISLLTMTVGNVIALQQQNVKRMLAYSSIAHAGYLMVGVTAGGSMGGGSVLFYLFGYLFMNIGAFGIVMLVEDREERRLELSDYSGLAGRKPFLSAAMALFMLALAGIPLTVGFAGKFYIFSAAVDQGFLWLVILAVLNSLVSVYYYVRVIIYMFMREGEASADVPQPSIPARVAIAISVYAVLHLGIAPSFLIRLARAAVADLLQ